MARPVENEERSPLVNVVVIMPVYNNHETLAAALRSALVEPAVSAVVVIDDGSTDGSAAVARAIGDERVRIESQANAGPSAARNRGIEIALAQAGMTHVLFLDADDAWCGGALDAVEPIVCDQPGAGVIVGARIEVDGERAAPVDPPADWVDRVLSPRGAIFQPQPFFGTSGMIVSRGVLAHGVRFDPRLRIGEDRDFAYRAAAIAPAYVTSSVLLKVTLHRRGDNLTGGVHLHRWLSDLLQLIEWHGQDPDAAAALHEQADWLLGHAARSLARRGRRFDPGLWRSYMDRYKVMGWERPWRAIKWRWLLAPILRAFVSAPM